MSAPPQFPVPLLLASASPRRRAILQAAGYSFQMRDPGEVEEAVTVALNQEALAMAKARAKAQAVAAAWPLAAPVLVIGADTLVVAGEEVLGKPLDRADARRMLALLSGTRHRVITGLCLWPARSREAEVGRDHCAPQAVGGTRVDPRDPEPVLASETSWVTLRRMAPEEIAAYVASGEADGKAGAYAIQETGDRFVERVEGSRFNVVGFPLERFQALLPEALRRFHLEKRPAQP